MQGAVLDQQSCDGALALVQTGLDDSALAAAARVGLQLHDLGLENDTLEQVADAHAGDGGHRDAGDVAAPVLGHDLVLGQLLLDALRVGGGLIHLVDGDDQLDVGGLGVVDGLDGLGHDAVIGRDDQDRNVGHVRAAGTHRGEGLVARGVQEGDDTVIALDLVRTDGLGDAAGLTLGDIGLADSVQNGGLAVVNMAHNDNDGRALDQIGGVVLLLHKQALLDGDVDLMLDLSVELLGDQGGGVEIDNVGDGVHLAHLHELGNDLGGALFQAGGQLADGDLVGDGDLQLRVAGLFQLDALQALGLGFTAAAKLLAAAVVAVVELFLLAGGLVLALAGHVAAVGQVVIAGVELVNVHIDGAGVNGDLRAVDLDLLGLDRLFNTSIGGQLLQGDALLAALFRLLLGLAAVFLLLGLRFLLGGGLGLLRRLGLGSGLLGCGGLLLRLGLLFCLRGRGGLLAAGKVGVEAVLGVLAGQGLQQDVELFFLKRADGLIGFAGHAGNGLNDLFGGHAELLGNISDLVFKIHIVWSSSSKVFCAQLCKVFVGHAEHGGGLGGKHGQVSAGQGHLLTGDDAVAGVLHMADRALTGVRGKQHQGYFAAQCVFLYAVIPVQQLAGLAAQPQCTQQRVLIVIHGSPPPLHFAPHRRSPRSGGHRYRPGWGPQMCVRAAWPCAPWQGRQPRGTDTRRVPVPCRADQY